jgi:hypothetical protein
MSFSMFETMTCALRLLMPGIDMTMPGTYDVQGRSVAGPCRCSAASTLRSPRCRAGGSREAAQWCADFTTSNPSLFWR